MKLFKENLNTAVFTTKFVMRNHIPITYVYHDEDGDWQFFGSETEIQDEDVMVVSLEQIIDNDPTILEIADLPRGDEASRENANSPWKRGGT